MPNSPIYRAEQARGKAARMALPPIVRDFYDEEYSRGIVRFPAESRHSVPAYSFIGLTCKVCRRWLDEGHRSSCPVPKVERLLKKSRKS